VDAAEGLPERQAALFRALGHPIRLQIVLYLAERPETCACDFTKFLPVTQPTVSAHLKTLREAGVVVTERRGNQICCSLSAAAISTMAELLARVAPRPTVGTGEAAAPRRRAGAQVGGATCR